MTTAKSKQVKIAFSRSGEMPDDQFYAALAVDESMPLWRGIIELLDRAEDQIWDQNRDADLTREMRADLGLKAGVVREIRVQLEATRQMGLSKLAGNSG